MSTDTIREVLANEKAAAEAAAIARQITAQAHAEMAARDREILRRIKEDLAVYHEPPSFFRELAIIILAGIALGTAFHFLG